MGGIVGQGLSIAAGYQDAFSWRQVGVAAIGAGVTAGLGAAFGGAQTGGFSTKFSLATKGANTAAAINAAVNSVASQDVMLVTFATPTQAHIFSLPLPGALPRLPVGAAWPASQYPWASRGISLRRHNVTLPASYAIF